MGWATIKSYDNIEDCYLWSWEGKKKKIKLMSEFYYNLGALNCLHNGGWKKQRVKVFTTLIREMIIFIGV
jgi:hypothetical protein